MYMFYYSYYVRLKAYSYLLPLFYTNSHLKAHDISVAVVGGGCVVCLSLCSTYPCTAVAIVAVAVVDIVSVWYVVVVVVIVAVVVAVVVAPHAGRWYCLQTPPRPSRPRPLDARACAISCFPGIF